MSETMTRVSFETLDALLCFQLVAAIRISLNLRNTSETEVELSINQ